MELINYLFILYVTEVSVSNGLIFIFIFIRESFSHYVKIFLMSSKFYGF
jgi:hypothetical protein